MQLLKNQDYQRTARPVFWRDNYLHVLGMKNPNTGVILEPEFCMVNHSCLSKSHTKFRLQDPPCVRVLHARDLYTITTSSKQSYQEAQNHPIERVCDAPRSWFCHLHPTRNRAMISALNCHVGLSFNAIYNGPCQWRDGKDNCSMSKDSSVLRHPLLVYH